MQGTEGHSGQYSVVSATMELGPVSCEWKNLAQHEQVGLQQRPNASNGHSCFDLLVVLAWQAPRRLQSQVLNPRERVQKCRNE